MMAQSMSDFMKRTSVAYNIELYIYTGSLEPNYMQYIDFFEQFASHVDYLNERTNVKEHIQSNSKALNSENYDVFISYSRIDSGIADDIVQSLELMKLKCWIDRSGHYSGKNYKSEIVDKIRHSHIILFISSENSNKSENVIKEISVAVELRKHIIPVRIDQSSYADSIAYDLTGIDFIDYEREKDELEQKILSQITLIENTSASINQRQ